MADEETKKDEEGEEKEEKKEGEGEEEGKKEEGEKCDACGEKPCVCK